MAKPTKKRAEAERARPAPEPKRTFSRFDTGAWQNMITGVGTARDKRTHATISPLVVAREECESLWRGDDVMAIGVERVPEEMTRKGFELRITPDKKEAPATDPLEGDDVEPEVSPGGSASKPFAGRVDAFPPNAGAPAVAPPPPRPPGEIEPQDDDVKEQTEGVMAKWEELEAEDHLFTALCYERAFGGGAILLGVDDGATDLSKPLNEERVKSFTYLTTYAAYELWPSKYYADPKKPKFGEPEIWEVCPSGVPFTGVPIFKVHESRLIILKGATTSRRARVNNRGWGDSIFVRVKECVRDFQMAFSASASLVDDFAQAVYKVKGLAELVASNRKDAVLDRMSIMDQCRSVLHAVMLDAEGEDFERKPTPITGLADLLEQLKSRVATAFETPMTFLFGQSPGGLNATGESDTRSFYDRIAGKQRKKLTKPVERVVKLIMLTPDGPTGGVEPEQWSIEFCPLWEETEKEQADKRKVQAEVDAIYVDKGVLLPDEVAASRFGGDGWSAETVIDFEARKQAAVEHAEALAKHEEEKAKASEKGEEDREFGFKEREHAMEVEAKKVKP
jgi:phage-related protein (TIGR01555 family)